MQALKSSKIFAGSLTALSSFPFILASCMAAHACDIKPQQQEFYPPVTNGDGIRFPLSLSPAVWKVSGCIEAVAATDGKVHLAYMLQMTNHTASPMTIKSVDVVDPDNSYAVTGQNKVVTILNEDVTSLAQPFIAPITLDKSNYTNKLAAGQTGEIYFDVTYGSLSAVPAHIAHRVVVSQTAGNDPALSYSAVDEPITVDRKSPIVLTPPLKGPGWYDGNGCCRQIGPHRGVLSPINGQVRPAEGFAVDFVQLDSKGRGYTGSPQDLSSYAFYGADVYAAASGTVVEVVRDLPNAVPGSNPPSTTADAASGNHIIMDVGEGRYIMYAHLVPGSPTVQVGDVVQTGVVIGKLGNSGNSSAPHLHFQVMDRPSSLGANGLPFVFDSMRRQGTATGSLQSAEDAFDAGRPVPIDTSTAKRFVNKMPLELDVFDF